MSQKPSTPGCGLRQSMDVRSVIELVWEQHPCLVVNKPGGLLTQSPPGIDSLEDRVKAFLIDRECRPGNIYLGVPHRLDRPASGAIVFARNSRATRRISEQFQGRTVEKTYWVLVEGQVRPPRGQCEDYMRKIPGQPRAEIVPRSHADARVATLRYEVLREEDFGSWLRVELGTGRTHQIRLQFASRGHAVLGDAEYGASSQFGPAAHDRRDRWIGLHSRSLAFSHPKSRERVVVEAPLFQPWLALRPLEYWSA